MYLLVQYLLFSNLRQVCVIPFRIQTALYFVEQLNTSTDCELASQTLLTYLLTYLLTCL